MKKPKPPQIFVTQPYGDPRDLRRQVASLYIEPGAPLVELHLFAADLLKGANGKMSWSSARLIPNYVINLKQHTLALQRGAVQVSMKQLQEHEKLQSPDKVFGHQNYRKP